MAEKTVEIPFGEGRIGSGYLATPKAESGPGVLVLHAWWGLNPFFRSLCDRLAEEGFVALAPDMHHGKVATTIEEAKTLISRMDGDDTGNLVGGATRVLQAHPAVIASGKTALGAIGFSMGSSWSLSLEAPFTRLVTFYGLTDPEQISSSGTILGHFAEKDEWEPEEYLLALETSLKEAGKPFTFYRYPCAAHWFFEADRPEFAPDAARLAWERTVAFLRG
jgi:carboxymethylenebutenolidase